MFVYMSPDRDWNNTPEGNLVGYDMFHDMLVPDKAPTPRI
jgi:hypothetical protein